MLLPAMSAFAAAPGDAERQELLDRQKQAAGRIEALKREQDLLLFQKAMYESDSKYLLLDLAAGKGEFRYRNRILKTFSVKGRPRVRHGLLALTEKRDGASQKRALLFGDRLAMTGAGGAPAGRNIPRLVLGKQDMAALFFILEPGAKLFIVK